MISIAFDYFKYLEKSKLNNYDACSCNMTAQRASQKRDPLNFLQRTGAFWFRLGHRFSFRPGLVQTFCRFDVSTSPHPSVPRLDTSIHQFQLIDLLILPFARLSHGAQLVFAVI